MKKTRIPNYILALLFGTAVTFTAIDAAQANDRSASFLTISTEQFLPDRAATDEGTMDDANKSPAPSSAHIETAANKKHTDAGDKAETEADAVTEPPSITVTLPARTEEKTKGSDLLAACRDKMFTDRGTGYCMKKKLGQEKEELQKTDQISYIALRHNEKPAAFRQKRRNLATENLAHRLEMETECHDRQKDTHGTFDKEMADVTCRIDHMAKYREHLGTRYLDYYDDKNSEAE